VTLFLKDDSLESSFKSMMKQIFPSEETPIALPQGFKWAAVEAGIRYSGRPDLALVDAGPEATAAAVFTRNSFAAAPVTVSREIIKSAHGRVRGVVVNAGCANAATGPRGLDAARTMASLAARSVDPRASFPFLVCSTGTIGVHLPMEKIEPAIARASTRLDASKSAFLSMAHAIMTTDTRPKYASRKMEFGGKTVSIAGCAKGSGMIYPRMATLLAFIFTDAGVSPVLLEKCFKPAVDASLNCLTVDGDTSTNDSAIVLASGASGFTIDESAPENVKIFQEGLLDVLQDLTMQLARDGEGATKLIEIQVSGARSFAEARKIALTIANSNLVKTAIHGCDANWGRIACAVGNSGVPIEPEKVKIAFGDLVVFDHGAPCDFSEEKALAILREEYVPVFVDLGLGNESAKAWTCDLTAKYIEINGAYRT